MDVDRKVKVHCRTKEISQRIRIDMTGKIGV